MGKRVSATEMLSAGRQRPPTPAETGTERLDDQMSERVNGVATSAADDQTTKPLDDQTSERLNGVATSAVDDQTTKPLDDQKPEAVDKVVTSAPGDQTSKPLDNQTPELDNVATSAPSHQATKPLDNHWLDESNREQVEPGGQTPKRLDLPLGGNGQSTATYQRMTVFLTPAQRQWLKLTGKQLPDGLSISDIVRLAVSRLSLDVTDGLDLVANLTDQAHADAEIFSGRRNRGMPPRAQSALS